MIKIKIVYIGGITDEYECEKYDYNGNTITIDCDEKHIIIPLYSIRYIEITREDGLCLQK